MDLSIFLSIGTGDARDHHPMTCESRARTKILSARYLYSPLSRPGDGHSNDHASPCGLSPCDPQKVSDEGSGQVEVRGWRGCSAACDV